MGQSVDPRLQRGSSEINGFQQIKNNSCGIKDMKPRSSLVVAGSSL